MEPQIQFAKDLNKIDKIAQYFDVKRGGVYKYEVEYPGEWKAYTNDFNVIYVEIGKHRLVVKDDEMMLNGRKIESLCWKTSRGQRCLSPSGIRIRIGAAVLAYYSFIDELPIDWVSTKRMLRYINNVERDQDVAELAVRVLVAKNTLGDEAEKIVKTLIKEIGKVRIAKYVH